MLTSLTRSTLRSILLVKCHPKALFFSIQMYSKDFAFQLLEFSIHKPISRPLKLFSIYTSCPVNHSLRKRVLIIKGEALRLLRTNPVKENFYKYKRDFGQKLCNRGYSTALVHKILAEVHFSNRTEALRNKTKRTKEIMILLFVTTNNPATPNLKKILMKQWHIIQQQSRLAHIFNQPPIISYRKKKVTQRRFNSRKTSLNHTAIINSCKQRSTFKKFVFKPEGNLRMIFG